MRGREELSFAGNLGAHEFDGDGGGSSPPLPTITSHTHPFPFCLFHITSRTAVSDTEMGKRHAAGVPP